MDLRRTFVLALILAVGMAGELPAQADAARGEAIFMGKGECTNCHAVSGRGSRIGPDLSDIGRRRNAVEIEQSIVDPDAVIAPPNRFVRLITGDGEAVRGRLLNQDRFLVQLLDSNEQLRTFERSELREFAFLDRSPMPSYSGRLTAEEIVDLVGYLVTLRGAR